jgi:putative ABC transport system permease protein
MTDVRFALRQLFKSPGFTLLALLTLALGLGLNTAIFSLINDLFLRGLPFKEPGRVVHMYSNARERNLLELAVSVPRFNISAPARKFSTDSRAKISSRSL